MSVLPGRPRRQRRDVARHRSFNDARAQDRCLQRLCKFALRHACFSGATGGALRPHATGTKSGRSPCCRGCVWPWTVGGALPSAQARPRHHALCNNASRRLKIVRGCRGWRLLLDRLCDAPWMLPVRASSGDRAEPANLTGFSLPCSQMANALGQIPPSTITDVRHS